MKTLSELKQLDLTDFTELDDNYLKIQDSSFILDKISLLNDNYIRLQGGLTPTQYGVIELQEVLLNLEQAQKFFQKQYGIRLMYQGEGIPLRWVNDLSKGVNDLQKLGIKIPDIICDMNFKKVASDPGAIAEYLLGQNKMRMNPQKSFTEMAKYMKKAGKGKSIISPMTGKRVLLPAFKSTTHPLHTLAHESFHHMHWNSGLLKQSEILKMAKFGGKYQEIIDTAASQVSSYASNNAMDFIAEVSTGIKLGGKTYSKEVMNAYNQLGGPKLEKMGVIPPTGITPTQYGAVKIVSNTWSAILEQKGPWPCPLCEKLDGLTLPEGHPDYERYQPPLHNKCKCNWIGSTTHSKIKPPINWKPPSKKLVKEFGNLIGALPEKVLPEIVEVVPKEIKAKQFKPKPRKIVKVPDKKLLPEEKWIKSLNKEEQEMFRLWQKATYSSMDDLRTIHAGKVPKFFDKKKIKEYKKYLKTLDTALNKAIPYEGNVYRGIRDLDKATLEKILKTKTMEFDALSSSSWKSDVGKIFARSREKDNFSVLFEIRNKTGVKIDAIFPGGRFAQEAEVLLRKGSKYRVVGQELLKPKGFNSKQTWKIIVEEIL